MATELQPKKKFREKLKDTYRISVVDVEDLKEVGRYQLSMRRIYALVIGSILLVSTIVIFLIFFTPIRTLVPGYGDIEENSKFIELRKKLGVLEDELETQMVYTQGLQNMLSGKGLDDLEPLDNHDHTAESNEKNTSVVVADEDVKEHEFTKLLHNRWFVPPVLGPVSAIFDRSINHFGVDILAPKNTAIKSISEGVVIASDFTLDTGNTLMIQHADNVISVYKHNSALLKKIGDKVSAGEAIAIIGNTGTMSDGPHLHFELWYDGKPVNPENFINFK